MSKPPALDLTSRQSFHWWTDERVRFNDLDALGHVNNNMFGVYFESGRVGFMTGVGLRNGPIDPALVVVRLEIDFKVELHYPAHLDVGVVVCRLGTTSITLGLGLFREDTCHATCRTVLVRVDQVNRRPIALSEEERRMFGPYLAQE